MCNMTDNFHHREGSDWTGGGAEFNFSWSDSGHTNSDYLYHEEENITEYQQCIYTLKWYSNSYTHIS